MYLVWLRDALLSDGGCGRIAKRALRVFNAMYFAPRDFYVMWDEWMTLLYLQKSHDAYSIHRTHITHIERNALTSTQLCPLAEDLRFHDFARNWSQIFVRVQYVANAEVVPVFVTDITFWPHSSDLNQHSTPHRSGNNNVCPAMHNTCTGIQCTSAWSAFLTSEFIIYAFCATVRWIMVVDSPYYYYS